MKRKWEMKGAAPKMPKRAHKMPSGLHSAARSLWSGVVASWELDDKAGLAHLENACRALTRIRELESLLRREGMLIRNRFGVMVPHPAAARLDAEGRCFRESMRALSLDVDSLYAEAED
jgi:phage terminase small subunit